MKLETTDDNEIFTQAQKDALRKKQIADAEVRVNEKGQKEIRLKGNFFWQIANEKDEV